MKVPTLLFYLLAVTMQAFSAPPVITSFSPASAATGITVTITGTGFTGVTSVFFGAFPATSFNVVSATQITAVVGQGESGTVSVTNADGTGTRSGFTFRTTALTGIFTDFAGYWASTTAVPNPVVPNDSHNLLAFTYNGVTYSTGVNNGILAGKSVPFTPGDFKALPVAGLSGTNASIAASNTYLAMARKVDGSINVANPAKVSQNTIRNVLIDGPNGLDLGTGVTNLPASANITFNIFNIDPAKVADDEPDIILTQIASPAVGNDVFSFVDANGKIVGKSLTQDMTQLARFGSYDLDLFNLTPGTPFNSAKAYTVNTANTNREIRLVGYKLTDFNITADSIGKIRALKITPSGASDYAFIAYNANSINIPPSISVNDAVTNTSVCAGGTASLEVISTPAAGGALSYAWEQSTNAGATWSKINDGGTISGASTGRLSVSNPTNGNQYRATVTEAGNGNSSTSTVFTTAVITPVNPSAVSVAGSATTCVNSPVLLTSNVTGGSNLYYQWQSNASGTYSDIPGAVMNNYVPPVTQTGSVSYRVQVSGGSGCAGAVTPATPATIAVNGISTVTPAARCGNGPVPLSATATGTIEWYNQDAGGTLLFTGPAFTTPTLTTSTTYYIVAGGCTDALRVPVTATIDPVSAGGTIKGDTTITTGTNTATLTLTGHNGKVVKWQASTDSFKNVITDIADTSAVLTVSNLDATTSYQAIIQSGACSPATSSVATVTVQSDILPVTFKTVKVSRQNNNIAVQWTVENQVSIAQYEVERSDDGRRFAKAYTLKPESNGALSRTYSWLDVNTTSGNNFYRIRMVNMDGSSAYSTIVKVTLENTTAGISVYPNPVTNGTISLQFKDMPAGQYTLRMFNSGGQVVYTTMITHAGGYASQTVAIPGRIPNGMYQVQVAGSGKAQSLKVWIGSK